MKRVAIYLRVSTDKQTTDNQRRELEAVAARSGWHVLRCMRTPASAEPKAAISGPALTPC
jgi:DNA invertase Pin-like site-specific DNA recombinase